MSLGTWGLSRQATNLSPDYPALVLTTPPDEEPVTLEKAREHLRDPPSFDELTAMIVAARQQAEAYTQRAFITQTWTASWSRFPGIAAGLVLPFPPLQSVTSVAYFDTSNTQQTLTENTHFLVDAASQPGVVTPHVQDHTTWPATDGRNNAVEVVYVAGYGAAAAVPQAIKHAILLMVGDMFQHRESIGVGTVAFQLGMTPKALLDPYRVWRFL